MKKESILFIVALIFIISFFAGSWLKDRGHEIQQLEKISMQYSSCDPVMNECQALLQTSSVSVLFLQKPIALQPFEVEVRTNNSDIVDVSLDFRMSSMNMGVNFYRLDKVSEGVWKGKITLPVCTSRRSDWLGELQINYQGKLWVAEYAFTQSTHN